MSKQQRVKFELPPRYFSKGCATQNGMRRETCVQVLYRAFGIQQHEAHKLFNDNPGGFTIICRKDQFADFIITRHEIGDCINGIKDLKPETITGEYDRYSHIAEITDTCRDDVKKIALALQYTGCNAPCEGVMDVTKRFAGQTYKASFHGCDWDASR